MMRTIDVSHVDFDCGHQAIPELDYWQAISIEGFWPVPFIFREPATEGTGARTNTEKMTTEDARMGHCGVDCGPTNRKEAGDMDGYYTPWSVVYCDEEGWPIKPEVCDCEGRVLEYPDPDVPGSCEYWEFVVGCVNAAANGPDQCIHDLEQRLAKAEADRDRLREWIEDNNPAMDIDEFLSMPGDEEGT